MIVLKYIVRITLTLVCLAGAVVIYTVYNSFSSEDVYFKQRSLRYYLLVKADVLKSVPSLPDCTVEYYSTSGDGPKLPATGVYFTCPRHIDYKGVVETFILSQGFIKYMEESASDSSTTTYLKGREELILSVSANGQNSNILSLIHYLSGME